MKHLKLSLLALILPFLGHTAHAGVIENEIAEIESSTVTKCEHLKTSWGIRLPAVVYYHVNYECTGRDTKFGIKVKAKNEFNQITSRWEVSVREVQRFEMVEAKK